MLIRVSSIATQALVSQPLFLYLASQLSNILVKLLFPALVAFEHAAPASATAPLHTLIFIGGLYDGLATVPYVPALASALPPSWRLAQILLSSS